MKNAHKERKAVKHIVNRIYYDTERHNYWLDGFPLLKERNFEVLVYNPKSGLVEWTPTRMSYYDKHWCLAGLLGYRVDGLYARRVD